jgi:hypothetical protein
VLRDYRVPAEVHNRMGMTVPAQSRPGNGAGRRQGPL